jgi:Tfp pilus assembly protein PilV
VRPGGEDGFLLVEVMVSALLVALIVVATFNGFDVANRTSADQRRHNQAAVLAAQSQEQLRSDPAPALEALEFAPHTYTQALNGTTYTISEAAKFINDKTQGLTCTAPSEASKQSSSYLQITSTVSWTALNASRPKVEQSSIITPPTGSSLEIDAINGGSPEEGVSGVNASVEYTGVESSLPTTVEGTTGGLGCVVFGAIPATAATLTVKPPTGYVTPSATFKIPPEQVTMAPNLTTHEEYIVNRGGTIKGEFAYEGKTEFESKPVKGETFVAFNTKLTAPEFILASTSYSYEAGGEERYTPLGGKAATTAETPVHTGYPTGNVFPWPSKYVVYAGDCPKNSVTATTNPEGRTNEEVLVSPGATSTVKIPLSRVILNVYTGKASSPGALTGEQLEVQITNIGCKEPTPDDANAPLYVHNQKLSGGHLENQFQPYGSFTLCVYSPVKKKNYTVNYANERQTGSTRNIYLEEVETGEQAVAASPPATKC